MVIVVHGAGGAVGAAATRWLDDVGASWLEHDAGADPGRAGAGVVVLATPAGTWPAGAPRRGVSVAPVVPVAARGLVDVPDAGWFGGIGSLLASVAAAEATRPVAVHVAYGLLASPGRAWRAAGPAVRSDVLEAVAGGGVALVDGRSVPEPLAVGRRLAWFPRPVGPAHAVAVPGHEARVVGGAATVRTWFAVGSLRAELLQAIGRLDPGGRAWGLLRRRAGRPVRGTSSAFRWAVVAEVREEGGAVVRSWANGTDPVAVTGALLGWAAVRLAGLAGAAPGAADGEGGQQEERATAGPRSVLDLGPAGRTLDVLADAGVLRWSVSRPEASAR